MPRINQSELIIVIISLALISSTYGAPMGPPTEPIRIKPEDLVDSTAQQGRLATEAIHNQMMAVNDLQKQQLAVAGASLQSLSHSGMQQQKLLGETVQNQLTAAFLQQQQLASATIEAQKSAAEALYRQILATIDLQQKLISAGLQMPSLLINSAQHPIAAMQSLASGQFPGAQQSAQSSLPGMGMVPAIGGFDKLMAFPFNFFSPLVTAAQQTMAAAAPGMGLGAG